MVMVKICGITRLEDALAALDAGADMLGFNLYPASRRYVSPSTCFTITNELVRRNGSIGLVGVFVNESADVILKVLDDCGLTLAQCHGDESAADLAMLKGRAYKAIRPKNREELDGLLRRFSSPPCTPQFLVDTYQKALYGGSGKTGDWQLASLAAQQYPIFLAGGLHSDNVANAIHWVHPWGVDVASGVESQPGIKDLTKMELFIKNAKGSSNELTDKRRYYPPTT